ncbi:hypothetical protein DXG01_009542 [Tephrocybe rancida]|nr:hypothetical protein DXG01_009542 [Tephrocybe rancida]
MPPPDTQLPAYHWRNIHPNASLHYVSDFQSANALIDALHGPVGFDLEWKPTFTKNTPENPVAIVQLANESNILVIQVSAMSEFPTKLRDFLESPDVVKAGVGIQNDAKKLHRDWQVSLRNCVDLSLLARCADNAQWKGKYSAPLGLARLIENYEKLALPKGRISRSNWEGVLSNKEVDYAGNDAHAGFLLYQRLWVMANLVDKVPKPVYYSFNFVRGNFCEPSGMHWNCHNPDYDPGPPPPPKPLKPPTARDVRRAAARAVASSGTPSGSVLDTQEGPVPVSPTSPRSPRFDVVQRVIHRRINSLPTANSGGAAHSPSSSGPSQTQPSHPPADAFPLHRRKTSQLSASNTGSDTATSNARNRRRRRRPENPAPDV